MKRELYNEEFFQLLADKLEDIFPKGEKCRYCGKKDWGRSRALSFNAFANIYFSKVSSKLILKVVDEVFYEIFAKDELLAQKYGVFIKPTDLQKIKKEIKQKYEIQKKKNV